MLPTDSSHLRKYLTTLGVAIIAATLSLVGLLYRMSSDLLVPEEVLSTLTPVARQVIEMRQVDLLHATEAAPIVLVLGALTGLLITTYGIIGWSRLQGTLDAEQVVKLQTAVFAYARMTESEKELKLDREAEQLAADSETLNEERPDKITASETGARSQPTGATEGITSSAEPLDDSESSTPQRQSSRDNGTTQPYLSLAASKLKSRDLKNRISDMEEAVMRKLERDLDGHLELRRDIVIRHGSERLYLDALVLDRKSKRAYGVDIKLLTNQKNVRNHLDHGLAHRARMESAGLESRILFVVGRDATEGDTRRILDRIETLRIEHPEMYSHIYSVEEARLLTPNLVSLPEMIDIH